MTPHTHLYRENITNLPPVHVTAGPLTGFVNCSTRLQAGRLDLQPVGYTQSYKAG